MRTVWLFIIWTIFLASCAFDQSAEDINRGETRNTEEKNRVLRSNYELVTGFYQGKLRLANEERIVTLGIYTLEIKEGTNSSGQPIFKPVLKAVYRQLFPVEVPMVLDGRFVPETGELSFVNPAEKSSTDILHTINGSLHEQKLIGQAKTPTGVLGDLELQFIQKKVEAPNEGDDEYIAQRLREQYELITGTYVGKITDANTEDSSRTNQWDVELGIYSLEVKVGTKPNGNAIFRPVLKAIFRQLNPVVPRLILDAQYIAETKQLLFINPSAASGDLHSINATLTDKVITGTAKRATGLWGNLQLNFKTKTVNTDPAGEQEDYNRRLTEEYKILVGNYFGTITPTGTQLKPFTVDVKIFIVQEAGPNGLIPKLKAYYHRTKDRYDVTSLTMNVEFKTELNPPGVDMSGQRGNGAMIYYVVLNGFYQNKEIRGTFHDQRGNQGPFRLKRTN